MLNPMSGMNESKTFALVYVMTEHMESGSSVQRRLQGRAFARLLRAVEEEARLRGYNRDISVRVQLQSALSR